MRDACVRTAAIELALDGRLSEGEERDLVEHLASCPACTAERASLSRLRSELGELQTPPNAFVMKRMRREVLEVAAGATARRIPRRIAPRVYALLLACVAVAALLFFRLRADATDLTITTTAGASYSREQRGGRDIVRLGEGAFDFDIHAHAGPRLVFVVPDGEIEDIGTRFHVVVRGDHTEEIAVIEGEVEFRKHGSAPLRLVAGMTYRRLVADPNEVAAADGPSPSAAPAPLVSAAPPVSAALSAPTPVGTHRVAAVAPVPPRAQSASPRHAAPPPSSASATPDPLQTGLAAEDIAYMEVVRLLRAGKTAEARDAARRWLVQYPAGLRRTELQAIAAGGSSPAR